MTLLENALAGARLLFAYTMYVQAPLDVVFKFTGEPKYWTRDFDGNPQAGLALEWEGKAFAAGSTMSLMPVRKDGTLSTVGAVRMELLHYAENREISFRFLNGNHLIYRFVYEPAHDGRTEFTVNVLVDAQSPPLNTVRQRLYAKNRRKASITDHLRVKTELERRAASSSRNEKAGR